MLYWSRFQIISMHLFSKHPVQLFQALHAVEPVQTQHRELTALLNRGKGFLQWKPKLRSCSCKLPPCLSFINAYQNAAAASPRSSSWLSNSAHEFVSHYCWPNPTQRPAETQLMPPFRVELNFSPCDFLRKWHWEHFIFPVAAADQLNI